MKVLFWNIGKNLIDRKLELLSEAISTEAPDIFCIAEGSRSKEDCQTIIDTFARHNYFCYYSPLAYKTVELNYKYKSNGLKIFTRQREIVKEQFSFYHQKYDGRIVALKTNIDFFKPTVFIFLHNKSKSGNREVTDPQRVFISELRRFIEALHESALKEVLNTNSEIKPAKQRIIIIGDFNLEPWDNTLRQEIYLNSSFYKKHNAINKRNLTDTNYFNPIAEYIFQSPIENLGGTYYSDSNGWALFDFVLYDTNESNITYNIITEFEGGSKLLDDDILVESEFINDELDHLPIITKVNN